MKKLLIFFLVLFSITQLAQNQVVASMDHSYQVSADQSAIISNSIEINHENIEGSIEVNSIDIGHISPDADIENADRDWIYGFTDYKTAQAVGVGVSPVFPSANILGDINEGYDVYLLAGQSNIIGRYGPIATPDDDTDADIFMLSRSTGLAVTAADPLDHIGETADTVGMGLTFAKARKSILFGNRKILLVAAGEGSTGFIATEWNIDGDNYNDAFTQVSTAMALDLNGGLNILRGIVWHQGEKEGPITEESYRNRMQTLAVLFRENLTGASLTTPFVAGQMVSTSGATGVQTAILNVGLTLPYADGLSSTSWGIGADTVHFTAAGQRLFGTDADTAYDSGLSGDLSLTAPTAPSVSAGTAEPAQSTLTITAPSDLGGSAVRHYRVFYKLASASTWTEWPRTASTSTSVIVTGLTNDSTYDFRTQAITSHSSSAYSSTVQATPEAASIELSADFVIDYSSSQTDSYDNSTNLQTWIDRKGNQDAWRGFDGTTEASLDPTFVGTAGDPAAEFEMNGRFFNLKANTTLIADMHKSTGGAWTTCFSGDIGGGDLAFMGTGVISTSAGFVIEVIRSVRRIRFRVINSAGSNIVSKEITDTGADLGSGAKIFCFGYDPSSGDYVLKKSGGSFFSGTTTASSTTDAAAYTFKMGRDGSGTSSAGNMDQIYDWAIANKLLSETEIDSAITALTARR